MLLVGLVGRLVGLRRLVLVGLVLGRRVWLARG